MREGALLKTRSDLEPRPLSPRLTVLLFLALTAAACATSPPPPAPPSSPIAAENVDDIKENLRSFDKDVKAFVASASDRSSVNDPNSFRAHELAGERNLSERAAELRRRIHAAFGTIPPMQRPATYVPPTPPAAPPPPPAQASPASVPSAPAPPEQQALINQLDASVKELHQAPPPPAAP
jgi:hypothetical protein